MLSNLVVFAQRELGTCYETLLSMQWDVDCMSLLISKCLSYGIVTLGAVFKLPQMIQLVKGTDGFSVGATMMEIVASLLLVGKMSHLAAFQTYGESVFLIVQDIIILFIVAADRRNTLLVPLLVAVMSYGYCQLPFELLTTLATFQIPLGLMSKMPQIFALYKSQSAVSQSLLTTLAYLLGSLARVFTTMRQVGDPMMLMQFGISSVLNLILLVQVLVYR